METKKGRLVGKREDEYMQWTITLTEEERDVLLNIVACHMDLVLEPKIKEAGKNGQTSRVIQLAKATELEKTIMEKLLDAGGK